MKELYVATSAAISREKQMALVANNLANVNTAGFKKEVAVFEVRPPEVDLRAMERSADPRLNLPVARQRLSGDRNYVRVAETRVDFATGAMRVTGRPLDLAIEETRHDGAVGFLRVQTPVGERLTRGGAFYRDGTGLVVDANGNALLDDGGNTITLENDQVFIGNDGAIRNQDGGDEVARVGLAHVQNPEQLEHLGHNFFGDRNGSVQLRDANQDDGINVRQGTLEMANVNVVEEMVRMIELQRAYTTYERSIQTMDDASDQAVRQAMNG